MIQRQLKSTFLTEHFQHLFNFAISAKLLKNYSTPQMFCEDFPSESNQSIPKPPESWKRMHGEMTREELAECMAPPGEKTFLTAMERRDQIFRKK